MQRALIVREPWISLILDGKKTWEMRSAAVRIRGRIGLIRQGTGLIVGTALLTDSLPSLSRENYMSHRDKHGIPESMLDEVIANRWTVPWVISDARRLQRPVSYQHKSGAVGFVILEPETSEAVELQDGAFEASPAMMNRRPVAHQAPPASTIPSAPEPQVSARMGLRNSAHSGVDEEIVFVFRPETAQSYGRALPNGRFVVLAGSTTMKRGSPNVKRDAAYRDDLVREGILGLDTDHRHYRFLEDHEFSSNSKAAGVVRDGNASGPSLWLDEKTGKTLADYLKQS